LQKLQTSGCWIIQVRKKKKSVARQLQRISIVPQAVGRDIIGNSGQESAIGFEQGLIELLNSLGDGVKSQNMGRAYRKVLYRKTVELLH
jgi:hypothetical protein